MKKFSNEQQPTAIDLFSGSGGLTCGIKQAGFKMKQKLKKQKRILGNV